jgi:hypothetical protein
VPLHLHQRSFMLGALAKLYVKRDQ